MCLTDRLGRLLSTFEFDKTSLAYLNRWSSLGPCYSLASSDWWRIFFLGLTFLAARELWICLKLFQLNWSGFVFCFGRLLDPASASTSLVSMYCQCATE
jgi:hypothetical protein